MVQFKRAGSKANKRKKHTIFSLLFNCAEFLAALVACITLTHITVSIKVEMKQNEKNWFLSDFDACFAFTH